jgi:hypothetical protein
MALTSSVRAPISRRVAGFQFVNSDRGLLVLWASFITLVVAAPWLLPGYLFGTDWPGVRHFVLPNSLDSSAPLQVALAAVAWVAGGEAAGKLLVLGSLFVAAALAYKALPDGGFLPRAAAATAYLVNPFVYGRLNYGQVYLLAAYATLPWALIWLRRLLIDPGAKTSWGTAAAFFLLGIFSPHVLLMAGLLAVALYVAFVAARKGKVAFLRQSGPWVLASIALAAVASSYWVVPLIAGRGYAGAVITTTGSGELTAYAVVPDRSLGLVPNLLGLYGFWAENTGRFASMKAFVPFWPAMLAALLVVCAIGAIAAFRQRSSWLSPWVAGLLLAGAVGFLLEMGVSNSLTSGVVTWLDVHFPIYRGMRDAGKWAALLALVYSQLTGLGVAAILVWLKKTVSNPVRAEWAGGFAAALLLALPLYYGNGLLFGAHGEIKPSQYPAGWYAADRVLVSDAHPGRTLFLPWHEYMTYSFIHNQNSVVAVPAPTFFSVPILASTNPEVAGIAPPAAADQVAVSALVDQGSKGAWAQVLRTLNVKYILVAKELDWQSYSYLDSQSGLTRVADLGPILVFRNNLVNP